MPAALSVCRPSSLAAPFPDRHRVMTDDTSHRDAAGGPAGGGRRDEPGGRSRREGKERGKKRRRDDESLRVAKRATSVAREGEPVSLATPSAPHWEFVHPRCARRRREDLEEVEQMLDAGETDIAREELVWLLSECPDFLEAHVHLGLLALEEEDPRLARGHFGRAVELGFRALEAAGNPRPLPAWLPGNEPFFSAAKGLVHALVESGRRGMALETARKVAALDPPDPLGIVAVARGGEGRHG